MKHQPASTLTASFTPDAQENPLSELPLLTTDQEHQLLMGWNQTARPYPRDATLHALFEEQAERTPDAVALVYSGERVTYRELNERANRLAHYLRALGVGAESLVGVMMERSAELVVALLGVLKAGGAYVPLDPGYPQARLTFMAEDAGLRVILTQGAVAALVPAGEGLTMVSLDEVGEELGAQSSENPPGVAGAQNLCYVMYTSGSTGTPKGIGVVHRGVARLVKGVEYVRLDEAQTLLLHSTISFDASTFELWGALLNGARLVVLAERRPSLEELSAVVRREGVTTLWLTAGLFHEMATRHVEGLRGVRQLLAGGDVLSAGAVRRVMAEVEGCEVTNGYGPTECTTFAACHTVRSPLAEGATSVPIGRPIANTTLYVLDAAMRPVPVGASGELYIGGDGLARGYLGRPALTAERFVPDPFAAERGARLYQTGDVVRYRSDGELEFLGRADGQVKLRGFRIELGEIESALAGHARVRQVAAVVRDDGGDKRLVAYVVADAGDDSGDEGNQIPAVVGEAELRQYARTLLPDHMVPQRVVMLEALPLTPNGKLDRARLPEPEARGGESARELLGPRNAVESAVAGIWKEVLKVEELGVDENFFDLGGHSLLATQVISRLRAAFKVEFPMQTFFDFPTIQELALRLEAAQQSGRTTPPVPIAPVARGGDMPLSFAQERVWFLHQLYPDNMSYNFQATLKFKGSLDVAALGRSLDEIIRRHEIFRTTFPVSDDRPVQVIHPSWAVDLPLINLEELPDSRRDEEAQSLIERELQRPFDLTQLPLIRWLLLRLTPQEHLLIQVEHHLVHDGWSFGVFLHELTALYQAFSAGRPSPLEDLPIQFADFASWQRSWMRGEVADGQLDYWKAKLADGPRMLELPTDRPRPSALSFRGRSHRIELPLPLCDSLRTLSRRQGVTLFMTMMSAFLALLQRYTGQTDICVGSGVANRRWQQTEALIGMVINTLALRTDLSGDPTLLETLERVRAVTLDAYTHQDVPFDMVVDALRIERSLSYSPLYQVMFSFHDAQMPDLNLPNLNIELREGLSNGAAKFDLNVIVIPYLEQSVGQSEKSKGISIIWEYSTDLFDAETVERLARHFETLLAGAAADPTLRLSELPLLSEDEERRLLVTLNQTARSYPRDATLHALFEEQAARTPDAVALVYSDERVSYRELNERANRVAHYLRSLGVAAESLVGVMMERSVELVVALLGVLKAGGAYVPLDPAYPEARLTFMAQDAGLKVVLTHDGLAGRVPAGAGVRAVSLDELGEELGAQSSENPPGVVGAQNLCYVIYTSGSTGTPKGVEVCHRGVTRLVFGAEYVRLDAEQTFLHLSPISFDASTFELWGALLHGARCVLLPERIPTAGDLAREIKAHHVSIMWLTSALFNSVIDESPETLASVNQLLVGGEALSVGHVRRALKLLPSTRLINGYGPTECTTFAACHTVRSPLAEGAASVPIGRPIANTTLYVLDQQGKAAPVGVSGELYIGGDGLARGYLGRPELTAERFVPDPFSTDGGARLYRTGDVVRHRSDGELEFLGRADGQVKLRGFRIELGEIEAALAAHPDVRQTVVLLNGAGEAAQLVAYVVPNDSGGSGTDDGRDERSQTSAPTESELRQYARTLLPDYMVPQRVVMLEALPLTPNGKLDRARLPEPGQSDAGALAGGYVAPQGAVEEVMAGIWAEVLGATRVGARDNFFELGGHSLLATRVVSWVRKVFKVEAGLRGLFEEPTVEGFVRAVRREAGEDGWARMQRTAELLLSLTVNEQDEQGVGA